MFLFLLSRLFVNRSQAISQYTFLFVYTKLIHTHTIWSQQSNTNLYELIHDKKKKPLVSQFNLNTLDKFI